MDDGEPLAWRHGGSVAQRQETTTSLFGLTDRASSPPSITTFTITFTITHSLFTNHLQPQQCRVSCVANLWARASPQTSMSSTTSYSCGPTMNPSTGTCSTMPSDSLSESPSTSSTCFRAPLYRPIKTQTTSSLHPAEEARPVDSPILYVMPAARTVHQQKSKEMEAYMFGRCGLLGMRSWR